MNEEKLAEINENIPRSKQAGKGGKEKSGGKGITAKKMKALDGSAVATALKKV